MTLAKIGSRAAAGGLPDRELARGALEHEQAEIDDQADFLGDGDEFRRRQAAELGMIPARQRLEAGDGAILQPHDRLVQHLDLLALDGAAQFRFHGQPVGLARAHRRLEDFDAVAADALGVIHREFGVLEHLLGAVRLAFGERQADRGGEEDFAVVEGDRRAQACGACVSAKATMRAGSLSDIRISGELVARQPRQRVLRLEQPGQPARDGEQDRIADRDADRIVDLLEAVEIDHQHRRPDLRVGAGKGEGRLHAVDEQFAVGQAGEIVVHRVEQQPLFGLLEIGDVGERADQAHHFAVGADHRPRLQREPEIMAVGGAQAEILGEAAAPLLDDAVERGAEAVAVERMQHVEPGRRRSFQRAALEAEQMFGFRAGVDLVGGDVPVPDHVAGAGQRQRAALDVGDDAVRDAAGEGVLHHREADQHHDQHQAAEQRRADDVVGDERR